MPVPSRIVPALPALALAACLLPASQMSSSPAASAGSNDPRSPHNLLANGTFDGGVSLPWTSSFTLPGEGEASVQDGALCLDIRNVGANRWDAQLRVRDMVIRRGHSYRVLFRAWSDRPTRVRPKVGMAGPPYAEYWADSIDLDATPRAFSAEFSMQAADDPTAELAFHAGAEMAASGAPVRVCIDDVLLEDPEFTRSAGGGELPVADLTVNQVGYPRVSAAGCPGPGGVERPEPRARRRRGFGPAPARARLLELHHAG
jgi:endoglucanase